jgi:translation initiation factor IF-2
MNYDILTLLSIVFVLTINNIDTSNCLLLGDFNFRQINWNKMEASSGLTEKCLNTIQDNLRNILYPFGTNSESFTELSNHVSEILTIST